MKRLVLVRHGESIWNRKNLFTGWTDVGLTEKGKKEAADAGKILKKENFVFDAAYTSVLSRAIKTLWIIMEKMDLMWIPVHRHWRLNERHYGALQGLNKYRTVEKYGMEQVMQWRRGYAVRPPALEPDDPRVPSLDPRYSGLATEDLPLTESLKDTVHRFLPCWQKTIASDVRKGRRILISAHGNSLRALVKYIDGIPEENIVELNIPTGIPLVYELNDDLTPARHYYLGDPKAVKKAAQSVADQVNRHGNV